MKNVKFILLNLVFVPFFSFAAVDLFKDMDKETLQKTGINKLTQSEKQALSNWLNGTKEKIIKYYITLLPAVFIVHILGFAAGYYVAKLLKLTLTNSRTISIEVGMQNSGLGSQLATKHFTALSATPCAISALFHCLIGSALAAIWSRKT